MPAKINVTCYHVDNTEEGNRYSIISISEDDPNLPGSSYYRSVEDVKKKYGKINWTYSPFYNEPSSYEEAVQAVEKLKKEDYFHWQGREVVILDHREFSNLTENWKPESLK